MDITYCSNKKCKTDCRRNLRNAPSGIFSVADFGKGDGPCEWYWKGGKKWGKGK